jgi:hypothetical protein
LKISNEQVLRGRGIELLEVANGRSFFIESGELGQGLECVWRVDEACEGGEVLPVEGQQPFCFLDLGQDLSVEGERQLQVKGVSRHLGDLLGKGRRSCLEKLVGNRSENSYDGRGLLQLDVKAIVKSSVVLLQYVLFRRGLREDSEHGHAGNNIL